MCLSRTNDFVSVEGKGGPLKRSARAVCAQCDYLGISPYYLPRNPHFVVLGASLLPDNTCFFCIGYGIFGFSPIFFSIFTYFHSPHVLLSMLISPHYSSPQCGHSASAS